MRRVPKLDPAEPSRIRIDPAHERDSASVSTSRDHQPMLSDWTKAAKSLTHGVTFGLLVFLLGQSLLVWAFLAGHFTAWSIANLISVIGVTVALSAIAVTLRNFERRIEALAKLVGRSGRKRIRRRTAKISRK